MDRFSYLERRYIMKNLDDNYIDSLALLQKMKLKAEHVKQEVAEHGGDGPDWMYVDGYFQAVEDIAKAIKLMEEV